MLQLERCFLSGVFLIILVLFAVTVPAQNKATQPTASKSEYPVYASVLDFMLKSGRVRHPMILDKTSTFSCDGNACNGFEMGGCNGLRGSDELPAKRMETVKRDLPLLQKSTITRFLALNQTCATLQDRIPTTAKYYLFHPSAEPKLPTGWDQPDFIYLSRVAIDLRQTQALVYVGVMSGRTAQDSSGAFVLLLKQNEKWVIHGSSAVWALAPAPKK